MIGNIKLVIYTPLCIFFTTVKWRKNYALRAPFLLNNVQRCNMKIYKMIKNIRKSIKLKYFFIKKISEHIILKSQSDQNDDGIRVQWKYFQEGSRGRPRA